MLDLREASLPPPSLSVLVCAWKLIRAGHVHSWAQTQTRLYRRRAGPTVGAPQHLCQHTSHSHSCTHHSHHTHALPAHRHVCIPLTCSPLLYSLSHRHVHMHPRVHTPPRHLFTPSGTDTPFHATDTLAHTQAAHDSDAFLCTVHTPLCPCSLAPIHTPEPHCCPSPHTRIISCTRSHVPMPPCMVHPCMSVCECLHSAHSCVCTHARICSPSLLCVCSFIHTPALRSHTQPPNHNLEDAKGGA